MNRERHVENFRRRCERSVRLLKTHDRRAHRRAHYILAAVCRDEGAVNIAIRIDQSKWFSTAREHIRATRGSGPYKRFSLA